MHLFCRRSGNIPPVNAARVGVDVQNDVQHDNGVQQMTASCRKFPPQYPWGGHPEVMEDAYFPPAFATEQPVHSLATFHKTSVGVEPPNTLNTDTIVTETSAYDPTEQMTLAVLQTPALVENTARAQNVQTIGMDFSSAQVPLSTNHDSSNHQTQQPNTVSSTNETQPTTSTSAIRDNSSIHQTPSTTTATTQQRHQITTVSATPQTHQPVIVSSTENNHSTLQIFVTNAASAIRSNFSIHQTQSITTAATQQSQLMSTVSAVPQTRQPLTAQRHNAPVTSGNLQYDYNWIGAPANAGPSGTAAVSMTIRGPLMTPTIRPQGTLPNRQPYNGGIPRQVMCDL